MTGSGILAASYIGLQGHGTARTGMRSWPAELAGHLERGELNALGWQLLFDSDPGRFSRMDSLSKVGLMAVELLQESLRDLDQPARDRLAVFVETSAGCLATDASFLRKPGATLFTYTLPSTVLGEICIRHRLRGPVLCLVTESAEQSIVLRDAADVLSRAEASRCICVYCEAVDSTVVSAQLAQPWAKPHWEAGALLLGPVNGSGRSYELEGLSLLSNCRRLVERGVH